MSSLNTVAGNQGSQAYGQDVGGGLVQGSVITATVLEDLGQGRYLLAVGKMSFEAEVTSQLEVGSQYKMIVDKGGDPPQLSVYNPEEGRKKSNHPGLNFGESRWMDKFMFGSGKVQGEVDHAELLSLIRSLGYDIDDVPEEVYQKIKNVLPLIEKIDAAPPAIRMAMAETLLRNIESAIAGSIRQNAFFNQASIENTIRLSGEIPRWTNGDSQMLAMLMDEMEGLSLEDKNKLGSLLLGSSKSKGSDPLLLNPSQAKGPKAISLGSSQAKNSEAILLDEVRKLISRLKKLPDAVGKAPPKENPELVKQLANKVVNDVGSRFMLASSVLVRETSESPFVAKLDRQTAIASFLKQTPGLVSGSVSALLEQYLSLGGKLEKLPVGDVLSAQQAWKGQAPQAMQLHRSGSLLFLSQEMPEPERNLAESTVLKRSNSVKFPIFLDHKASADPSTSLPVRRIAEFSDSSGLPKNNYVEKLLNNWVQNGNALSELRAHISSIQAWVQLLGSQTELKGQITEYLFRKPIFSTPLEFQSLGDEKRAGVVEIIPQTREALDATLKQSGSSSATIPNRYLNEVLASLQSIAGENKVPSQSLLDTAAWLMGKQMVVSRELLMSLNTFQGALAQQVENPFLGELAELKEMSHELPANLRGEISMAWVNAPRDGNSLRQVIQHYQEGNGLKVRESIEKIQEHLLQNPEKSGLKINALLSSLSNSLRSQEEYLGGLKQYNIQAQRADTPQLLEIPLAFGEDFEKAMLRIFKRDQGQGKDGKQKNFKVVIDLDLKALGKVRSEVNMLGGNMQIDFLTQKNESLQALKDKVAILSTRLEEKSLNTKVGFHLKKIADEEGFMPLQQSITVDKPKFKIDISV